MVHNNLDLTQHKGISAITTEQELIDSDVPLEVIVASYNKGAPIGEFKKVGGFKTRQEGAKAFFGVLGALKAKAEAQDSMSESEKLASAVKAKKEPKAKKEKAEGAGGTGKASPLAGKFWARSGNPLQSRRLGGTGIGVNALKYIIDNPGCSTEDYLANSGGGRFNDLNYDLDKGNVVALTGATPEERAAEIAALTEKRKGAEAAEAEKLKQAEAEKAAKAKAKEEEKAKKEAEKAAKAEAKAKKEAEDKAKAEADAAAKAAEGEKAPAENA